MNATTTSSRIYGYGRVSTTEQTTDNQRREIEAAGYALTPRRWFADAISGRVHASQRPQFSKLLERLEEGDTLVVSKLDRLGRDSIDVEQTLQRLEGMGVSVVADFSDRGRPFQADRRRHFSVIVDGHGRREATWSS